MGARAHQRRLSVAWAAVCLWTLLAVGPVMAAVAATGQGRQGPITLEPIERPELPLRGMVARVDLTDPRVRVVCPLAGDPDRPTRPPYVTTLQTVSAVLRREKLELAVNGDFFAVAPVEPGGSGPRPSGAGRSMYVVGAPAMPLGASVSGGKVHRRGPGGRNAVSLVVDAAGRVSIEREPELRGAAEVVSGNRLLVEAGTAAVAHDDRDTRAPRTLAGLTADGRTLVLVVVDGRSVSSRGVTLGEAAELLVGLGVDRGINLDGGGSSVMVRRGDDGLPLALTRPSDGNERPVANVLGIRLLPEPR
ncbi:MAG: phosphodiester glycosidase family protein [Tepidisphaerales bacterium]